MKDRQSRELYECYTGAMERWQIKLAIGRLKFFHLPHDCWEDAMQELAIVIHEFRFDPAKAGGASRETILCRAIDNRIRMMARGNARRLAFLNRLGRMRLEVEDTHLPDDAAVDAEVRELMKGLTPAQQKICLALIDGQSTDHIAAQTKRSWGTINNHIRNIRKAFTKRGYGQ